VGACAEFFLVFKHYLEENSLEENSNYLEENSLPTDFVGACSEFFQEEGSRFICAEPSAECRRAFLFSFSSPDVLDHAHFRFLQRADAATAEPRLHLNVHTH
jgi:hypothetical protein